MQAFLSQTSVRLMNTCKACFISGPAVSRIVSYSPGNPALLISLQVQDAALLSSEAIQGRHVGKEFEMLCSDE